MTTAAKLKDGRLYADSGESDSLVAYIDEDGLNVSIDSPWSGSTEGGFGQTLYFTLDREAGALLATMLNDWLAKR